MLYRLILPDWAKAEFPALKKVLEGKFSSSFVLKQNQENYYNAYYLPNYPSLYEKGTTVDGSQIDTFNWCFVDMDLKEGKYADKDAFIEFISGFPLIPTRIHDSGNGIHAYWRVTDLDAMSFLRLQRRLCRHFNTDEAVSKIYQLMRVPGTINTKNPEDLKLCEVLYESESSYTCEQLDNALPKISLEDEEYCKRHYDQTHNSPCDIKIDEKLPNKFLTLVRKNKEVSEIWSGNTDDRSKSDYRLGHILWATGFTREEAISVLANAPKAMSRSNTHRVNYALGIIDKIFIEDPEDKAVLPRSVKSILSRGEKEVQGTRIVCHRLLDNTQVGFRVGHVIGLVAGSGVGKTSLAVNMFRWFAEFNTEAELDHLFVSLEQTESEIAQRWETVCAGDTALHDRVHILSNYDEEGNFRNLSLDDIAGHIGALEKSTGRKIGCCVIDHIGVLSKQNKNGESQGIIDVCKAMKPFAIKTKTLVVMQSQAPREKAGIGDLELNKDAAFGTVFFESFCDWLICLWQPLKRMYRNDAPTVMSFKFAKIRHKKQNKDVIQEDVRYNLFFDPKTEQLRELTEEEEKSFNWFNRECAKIRGQDRKTEVMEYVSRRLEGESNGGKPKDNQDTTGATGSTKLYN